MALSLSDAEEFAGRLAYLLRRGRMNAKALSFAIGRPKGYISWLMNEARDVDVEATELIAKALAGQGALVTDPTILAAFLLGIKDDPDECIDSTKGSSPIPGSIRPDEAIIAAA